MVQTRGYGILATAGQLLTYNNLGLDAKIKLVKAVFVQVACDLFDTFEGDKEEQALL